MRIGSELFIDRGMTTLRSEDVDEKIRKGVCHAGNHRSVAAPRLFCLPALEPRASRHRANDLAPLRGCFVSEVRVLSIKLCARKEGRSSDPEASDGDGSLLMGGNSAASGTPM